MTINPTVHEMGWSDNAYAAANKAVQTSRHGYDNEQQHERIERMDKEEIEAYVALVDGWVNAYQYARESGKLHHPTDGTLLGEWNVTTEFQMQYDQLIGMTKSILRRAMRHANKLGGSYEIEQPVA